MANQNDYPEMIAGTAGGTLLTILVNIHTEALIETAVLACVGALVSFIVSLTLKWLTTPRRLKK